MEKDEIDDGFTVKDFMEYERAYHCAKILYGSCPTDDQIENVRQILSDRERFEKGSKK